MATYTPTITPRLRMNRHSPVHYDRSPSQIASTSESGPSHFPDFSQLVDVNLNDVAISDASNQPSSSIPSTPSTVTRPENPAAVLRALLLRLPVDATTPTQPHQISQQYASERESDYDVSEHTNATPSMAQESLKDIFSKARREPGDTPRKPRPRRNSVDTSEVDASPRVEKERADNKGKRRSLSDDEIEQTNQLSSRNRSRTRSRVSNQPITMEFLRERFSNSHVLQSRSESPSGIHNSSDETAIILRELNSSQATPPAATSTPQQSLRMSINSQFHSNLLDQDTEMQHAIQNLGSYEETSSVDRSMSPPTMRKRPKPMLENNGHISTHSNGTSTYPQLHGSSSQSNMNSNHAISNQNKMEASTELYRKREHDWNKPHPHHGQHIPDHSHSHLRQSDSQSSIAQISHDVGPHRSHSRRMESGHSHDSRLSPIPNSSHRHIPVAHSRSNSPSVSVLDDVPIDIVHERERNWNAPQPTWHKPPLSPVLSLQLPENGHPRTKSMLASPRSRDGGHDLHRKRSVSPLKSHIKEREEHRRSFSPSPPKQFSPTPSRTSSLQAIDNTYRHNDPSLRHPSRSLSPLPSFSKKRPASPNISTASRKLKTSITTPTNRQQASPRLNEDQESSSGHLSRIIQKAAGDLSVSLSRTSFPEESPHPSVLPLGNQGEAQSGFQALELGNDTELEDLRETDFSSQGETPKLRHDSSADVSDDEDHEHNPPLRSLSRQDTPPFLVSPTTPRILVDNHTPQRDASTNGSMSQHRSPFSTPITPRDHTPPRDASTDIPMSPSTPPRHSTPMSSRKEFKTPTPPKGLPALPSPSSSEESGSNRGWTGAATPQLQSNDRQDSNWMPTPRPPGGWLVTPKPPREARLDDNSTIPMDDSRNGDDDRQVYLRTPTTRVDSQNGGNLTIVGKTPKPPGGWVSTPVLTSSPNSPWDEVSEQRAGLLTPMPSLSKGSSFDPKTPGVPGGWLATPAVRKSILKVRFNSDTTMRENAQTDPEGKLDASLATDCVPMQPIDTSSSHLDFSKLPPSPRSPRRCKTPNIRVLDAFGRKQESVELESEQHSRSMLRVVDAMGREVPTTDPISVVESKIEDPNLTKSGRGELLSRIRQGLDDLAEEFDDVEKDDRDLVDLARIKELDRVSKQARRNRERLQSQDFISRGTHSLSRQILSSSKPPRNNLRFYAVMLLVQLFFLLLLYRIALTRARKLFFNTYYDPFNPEVHLYISNSDPSIHPMDSDFSRTSWYSLLQRFLGDGEKTWYWLHFTGEMPSYFWNLWNNDAIPKNRAWLPT